MADLIAKSRVDREFTFSANNLLDVVGHPDEHHEPNATNNVIGSIFREASTSGVIETVGVERSRHGNRKGGMVQTWRAVEGPPSLFD